MYLVSSCPRRLGDLNGCTTETEVGCLVTPTHGGKSRPTKGVFIGDGLFPPRLPLVFRHRPNLARQNWLAPIDPAAPHLPTEQTAERQSECKHPNRERDQVNEAAGN